MIGREYLVIYKRVNLFFDSDHLVPNRIAGRKKGVSDHRSQYLQKTNAVG